MATKRLRLWICLALFPLIPVFAQDETETTATKTTETIERFLPDSLVNINAATTAQLMQLGFTREEAQAIEQRLLEEGDYKNIFELYETAGVSRTAVDAARSRIVTGSMEADDAITQRRQANAYRIEQLVSDEGFSEGLADQLADQILDPININDATIDDLTDIQNVSAVDAVAIRKRIETGNPIASARELRQTPGLSYYGYSNARPYLTYEPTDKFKGVRGFYQVRMFDTPYLPDNATAIREDVVPQGRLDTHYKLRLVWNDWKFGASTHRGRNESSLTEHPFSNIKLTQGKLYFERDRFKLGPLYFKHLVLGNYFAGFGQGLIMSSGDYFSPRATGFGFSKHISGIAADLSRTEQFTYRGIGAEFSFNKFEATLAASNDWKDALLNPDGSVNRFMVLSPRYPYDIYPISDSIRQNPSSGFPDTLKVDRHPGVQSMLDNTQEKILAGNFAWLPFNGLRVGVSWLEAMYSRPIKPTLDSLTILNGGDVGQVNDDFTFREIEANYSDSSSSKLWSGAKSKLRVYGFDWQYVYNNFSWQGEFGEIEKRGSLFKIGDDPHALVTSLYAQYSSFNLLMLYRDRQLAYDNPYDRGYANYARFKGTIYEDEFYMKDVTYGQLYDNSYQPQPERGWLLSGRYQWTRQIVTSFELDQWSRKSDDAEYYRWVMRGQYRPIFPLQFNLRLSDQSRAYQSSEDPMYYRSMQGRLQARVRLANFDEVSVLYSYAVTKFAPRPRLVNNFDPNGKSPVSGQSASPSEGFGLSMRHNMSRSLWLGAGALVYSGFFWNYEEGDFYVRDGNAIRLYFATGTRMGPGLYVKAKVTTEHSYEKSNLFGRYKNSIPSRSKESYYSQTFAKPFGGDFVTSEDLSFRLQLDYHF